MNRTVNILRNFSFVAVLLAAMFKVMHWPGANMILLTSLSTMYLYFTLRYVFKSRLVWQDHMYFLMSTCVLSFVLTRLLGYPDQIIIIGVLIAIIIFVLTLLFKKNTASEETLINEASPSIWVLGIIPLTLLIIGIVFRILDQPGASLFFIAAFIAQIIHLVLGMRSNKENRNEWDEILDSNEKDLK